MNQGSGESGDMASLSCRGILLPELAAVAAAGLREQDCRNGGVLLSSSSESCLGVGGGKIASNISNNKLRLSSSSSSWLGCDSLKKKERSCLLAAASGMAVSKKEVSMSVNAGSSSKILTGSGGAVLEDVPHLTDWLPDLPVSSFPPSSFHILLLHFLVLLIGLFFQTNHHW